MDWFHGSVSDAIQNARRDNKIMTIFVYNDGADSEQVTSALSAPVLAPLMPSLVALRLKQPSTELSQFAEIYPVLVVPSLYMICPQSGVALEVLAGPQSAEALFDKISAVLKSRNVPSPPVQSGLSGESRAHTETPTPTQSGENLPSATSSEDVAMEAANSESPSASSNQTFAVDDKVERAQRLIEAVRHEKAEAQRAEEQRKEIERRESLKNLQRIRREMEDRELKNFVAEKNKERDEEKRYRAQLQEQIRQDRLERQQRSAVDRVEGEERRRKEGLQKQEEADKLRAQNATSANILFRMPDGSTVTHLFEAEARFIEVRQYITDAKRLTGSFNLALNFPRRIFETDSDQKTLRELQLAPSAVLLVIARSPSRRGLGGNDGSGACAGTVATWRSIWDVLALPFTLAMGFFTSFVAAIFPSVPATTGGSEPQSPALAAGTSPAPSAVPHDAPGASRARVAGSGSTLRQRKPYERTGNIHRLNTDNDDSDNENNTWNGNSTQQM